MDIRRAYRPDDLWRVPPSVPKLKDLQGVVAQCLRNIWDRISSYCKVLESCRPRPATFGRGRTSKFMANTTVQTGANPAPKSLPARFIGIITSPRATYESVVAHPKWFGMLALTSLIALAVHAGFPLTTEGRARKRGSMRRPRQSNRSDPGQRSACTQRMEKMAPYCRLHHRCGRADRDAPIIVTVPSPGILFAIFNAAMGGNATFKQVFTVVVHAGANRGARRSSSPGRSITSAGR